MFKLIRRSKNMDKIIYSAIFVASVFLIFLAAKVKNYRKQRCREAPGPRSLPLLGSLHRILGKKLPHHTLRDLSAVYGPIMSIKLGEVHAVVISSAEAAREIMKMHDAVFASRPTSAATRAFSYGSNGLIFTPYGEFWRQMSRINSLELLSTKHVRSFRAVREEEASHLIRSIAASSGSVVDLSGELAGVINNIMARKIIGGRCDDQKLFFSALSGVVEFVSGFTPVDLFPSFPFIGRITGYLRKIEQCQRKLDLMNEKIVQEHREKMAKHSATGVEEERLQEDDITKVLLRIQRQGSHTFPISDDVIKAIINDLLLAGSETTTTTLEWTMSELIRNPRVMRRAQREVREAIGNTDMHGKLVEEEVVSGKLPYLRLVIKEALRLHPAVPLLLPRENQESCEVMGYEIPAKTRVIVNMWAITRDAKYWDDPDTFWPERFEGSSLDFKGASFEYAPFGSGRRICPGMRFALATMEIVLAHLLYYFDWEYLGKELDMKEVFGVTIRRGSPLCIVPTLRFPLPTST